MVSRRLYFGVCIVLPLFCIFFMSTIFGNGQMENIPVGIVDGDNTSMSREVVRTVEAVPTFKVMHRYTDETAARRATQSKEIYGYLVIPTGFTADVMAGRQTTLAYYYHYALLSVGGEVRGAFETVLRQLSMAPIVMQATALGIGEEQITTFLLPVKASSHPLFNPDLDYSVYLSNPFFFILFQVIILLTTVYAVGSEIKFGTGAEWLSEAGGNIVTAVAGKLLPYTVIFSLMSILANYVMFGLMHIPFSCGFWPLNLTAILFVVSTPSTGGLHLLCLSRTQHHYQHRVDGRFAWCNAVRCDLSCVLDVCSCALCFLLVPCPPFHRDLPEFALRGLRFCLDLGELRCAALLPSSLAADVAPFEESDCERRDVEASRLLKKEI